MTAINDHYTKLCLLPQWGTWGKSGNSVKFLGYTSWIGKIIDRRNGRSISVLNEDECEQTHIAFIHVKTYAPFEATCLHEHYVDNISIQEAIRTHRAVYNTYAKYLKQGEKRITNIIADIKRSGKAEISPCLGTVIP